MSNHNGNANKMVDTPRTDEELVEMITGDGPVKTKTKWVHSSVCIQLERELNAANDKIKQLEDNRTKAAANSLANMMAYEDAIAKIKRLEREVELLRLYGNKDCTAMADEALKKDSKP